MKVEKTLLSQVINIYIYFFNLFFLDSASNSDILNSTVSNDGLKITDLNDKKTKKLLFKSRKKIKINDFDDIFENEVFKPNIKVKELGTARKEKKINDSAEKKPKIKKFKDGSIKPFSIKVSGFDLDSADSIPIDNGFVANLGSENTPKKKQYKRKDKPKDKETEKKRKPKGQVKTTLQFGNEFGLNLEDGELPPSPSSNASFSSLQSRSISPTKLKRAGKNSNEIFGDNEAAKMLVLMSESNENVDDRKRKFDELSGDGDSIHGSSGIVDLNEPKPKESKKKPSTSKRLKGMNSKKQVKSAETIESSGDSSSDDNEPSHDSVSALPETMDNIPVSSSPLERKRHNSASSVSSLSSEHSSISSSFSKRASSAERVLVGSEKLEKSHKSSQNILEPVEKEKKDSKHKKNKKHSKEKHREEKGHKKHKKQKPDKEKHKEHKEKEKSYKPKLNIKLGPNLDFKRPIGRYFLNVFFKLLLINFS